MIAGDNYVYLAPPKTGTRSVYAWLQRYHGGQPLQDHGRTIPEEHRDKFVFATVRNPYARALSIYWTHFTHDAYVAQKVLIDATGGATLRHMMEWFVNGPIPTSWEHVAFPVSAFTMSAEPVMFLRTEHLWEDAMALPFSGLGAPVGGHENAVTHSGINVRDRLATDVRKLVRRWADADFDIGGYER